MQRISAAYASLKGAIRQVNSRSFHIPGIVNSRSVHIPGIFYLLGIVAAILFLTVLVLGECAILPKSLNFLNYYTFLNKAAVAAPLGLPFWTLVIVESCFLYRLEQLKPFNAIFAAFTANIFALISGVLILFVYRFCYLLFFSKSDFFISLIPAATIFAVCFGLMLNSFCQRTGYLAIFRNWKFQPQIPLIATAIFWGWSILNLWLGQIVFTMPNQLYAIASIPAWIGTASIILNGFIFNLVAKGWLVAYLLPQPNPTLAKTVISMSVWSYPILAVAFFMKPSF
jgi:hypothetical protein